MTLIPIIDISIIIIGFSAWIRSGNRWRIPTNRSAIHLFRRWRLGFCFNFLLSAARGPAQSTLFAQAQVVERPGVTGIAHLFEHMMFKGTPTIGASDYRAESRTITEFDGIHTELRLEETALIDRRSMIGCRRLS